jgi:hypothetical protein
MSCSYKEIYIYVIPCRRVEGKVLNSRQAYMQRQKKLQGIFKKIGKEKKRRPGLRSVFITTLWPVASSANTIRINLGELGTEEKAFSCQWST